MKLIQRLLKHAVVRNVGFMYIVQFSGYIMPLLALPYLTRVLSTEKFGLVAYSQIFVWYFVILTDYGFNLTATRSIAVNSERPEEVSKIFSAVMVAKSALTLIGLFILVVAVLAVPALRPNLNLFLISFLTVIGYMLFPGWLFQGMQRMGTIAARDFAAKLLSLLSLFVFVHNDSDYLLAAASQSAGLLLAGIVGLISVRRNLGVRFRWPEQAAVWAQLKEGWPAFISLAVSAYAIVTNTFLVGLIRPPSEVAYYSGGQRIIAALRSMVIPLSSAIYPHTSQKAAGSERGVIEFVRKYAPMFIGPFLLIGVVLVFGSPLLVKIVLGPRYVPSILVLQIMGFTPALFAATQVYSTYYMLACGYDKQWMRIILTTVAANFVILLPALFVLRGSEALAVTALLSEATGTLLYYLFYRKKERALALADASPNTSQ